MDYIERPENTGVIGAGNPTGSPEGAKDYPDTSGKPPWVPKPPRGPEDHEHVERPPFRDRNLAALKIGSRSPRVYGRVAEGILADLLVAEPDLAAWPEEAAALASTEAVVALLRLEIAARGLHNPDGSLRAALIDRYFTAERTAAKRRDAIGVSPIGEAVLARERAAAAALSTSAAVDLSTLAARGRDTRIQRGDLVVTVLEDEKRRYAAERAADAATPERTALAIESVTERATKGEDN